MVCTVSPGLVALHQVGGNFEAQRLQTQSLVQERLLQAPTTSGRSLLQKHAVRLTAHRQSDAADCLSAD